MESDCFDQPRRRAPRGSLNALNDEQKKERAREIEKERIATKRQRETSEQTANRNKRNAASMRVATDNETPEQTANRRNRNAECQRAVRANEMVSVISLIIMYFQIDEMY